MKYKLEITGMHCQGCKNLISIIFEEQGITKLNIDYVSGSAVFETEKNIEEVKKILKTVKDELPNYSFSNLQISE